MNYSTFRKKTQKQPLILTHNILMGGKEDKQAILNQLKRWQDKGLITKLRRGIFVLNSHDLKISPSMTYIANQLYGPSYVSLEYALSYYGLIPERATDLTSITTKKTQNFKNKLGVFTFQHIKREGFRGFTALKDDAGLTFFMAEPEKAILDLFYLGMSKFREKNYESMFEDFYRLQNIEMLSQKKLLKFANLFSSKKLLKITDALCAYIEKEGI